MRERSELFAGTTPRSRILLAVAAYSAFLLVGFLFPFDFSPNMGSARQRFEHLLSVPFSSLYFGAEFTAEVQVLVRLLLFAPLGALWEYLAIGFSSQAIQRVLRVTGVGYSLVLALAIELMQVFMPSRVADLTDVAICTVAAAIGLKLTSRLLSTMSRV